MRWTVELWRGVAALLVLWAHWGGALGWPMGVMGFSFTGVDLFFVLSGFVFAPQLLGGLQTPLAPYVARRLARIYPAYLVALAVYLLLTWLDGRPLLYVTEHLAMAHLQSREMAFYYSPAFWSLPTELAFYALVPLLGWACQLRPLAGAPRHVLLGGLLLAALCLRLALLAIADGEAQNAAYVWLNHLPGFLVEFLLGVAVWQCARQPIKPRTCWALAALGLLSWLALTWIFGWLQPVAPGWLLGQLGLGAALCFAALLRASVPWPAPAPGSLLGCTARWAGKLSYPVYLLHMAWLPAGQYAVEHWGIFWGSAAVLVGLAASCLALHLLVEEPARRWGRKHQQATTPSTAAA